MRYTINLDCKTHSPKKDGTVPLLLRVSLNGKIIYINLGKFIKLTQYDQINKCVKTGSAGSTALTSFIDRQKVRIDTIISDYEKKGLPISVHKLREIYNQSSGKVKSECFYEYASEEISEERRLNEISSDTLDTYDTEILKLKKFRTKLSVHDIDKKFLQDYKLFVLSTLGQANNTAYHSMCFLRKYTRKLFKDGRINKYPFDDFIVGKPFIGEPDYLEPEEINILQELYDSKALLSVIKKAKTKYAQDFAIGIKYQEVLRYYLAACYCGLRHSDIKTLRTSEIRDGFIVKQLRKGRLKRKKTVRIPIRKRLLALLTISKNDALAFDNPVMECNQTNRYLKAILEIAGINKHLAFHSSRHSFAINSLLLGIKIEVVSDILGHSELTTTQRYARVVDRLREKEMNKWDNMLVEEKPSNTFDIVCTNCDTPILQLNKNVINQKKINCICPSCKMSNFYDLDKEEVNTKTIVFEPTPLKIVS